MTFTREERAIIEDMLNKIEGLKAEVVALQSNLRIVSDLSGVNASKRSIQDMDKTELKSLLASVIKELSAAKLVKHNHKTDLEGGPCFAELGAELIAGEDVENQTEEPEE